MEIRFNRVSGLAVCPRYLLSLSGILTYMHQVRVSGVLCFLCFVCLHQHSQSLDSSFLVLSPDPTPNPNPNTVQSTVVAL